MIFTLQGADPTPEEAKAILTKMAKVVDLTEKELDLLVSNKARIDELHVGGESTSQQQHIAAPPEHGRHVTDFDDPSQASSSATCSTASRLVSPSRSSSAARPPPTSRMRPAPSRRGATRPSTRPSPSSPTPRVVRTTPSTATTLTRSRKSCNRSGDAAIERICVYRT